MRHTRLSRIGAFCLSAAIAIGTVLLLSAPASGATMSAVGTASQVTDGTYAGWYLYSYTLTWDLSKGLSHVDFTLPPASLTGIISFAFDSGTNGQSTGHNYRKGNTPVYTVSYDGAFEPRGDPSISLTAPILKWEPVSGGSPGKAGVGTFWFYSDAAPLTGTFTDVLAAKYGRHTIYGDLTGAYPSSSQPQPIPEPATIAYLVFGLGAAWVTRRRRLTRA
jgi:hypothetical protein